MRDDSLWQHLELNLDFRLNLISFPTPSILNTLTVVCINVILRHFVLSIKSQTGNLIAKAIQVLNCNSYGFSIKCSCICMQHLHIYQELNHQRHKPSCFAMFSLPGQIKTQSQEHRPIRLYLQRHSHPMQEYIQIKKSTHARIERVRLFPPV